MKRMQRVFGNLDALRYADDRLDDERRAAFVAHLADDPQDAERVAIWTRQNDVIRASFASVGVEPVPLWLRMSQLATEKTASSLPPAPPRSARPDTVPVTRLADQRRSATRTPDRSLAPSAPRAPGKAGRRSMSVGLTAILLVSIGFLVAYTAHLVMPAAIALDEDDAPARATAVGTTVSRAVDAYRTYATDPVRPVEVPASQTAVLDRWLQHRVSVVAHAPDLRVAGLTFLGGRLVPGEAAPAAYFVYESEGGGDRLGLYVARSPDAPAISISLDPMSGGGSTMTWTEGRTSYVVTAGQSVDWLSRNAEAIRQHVAKAAAG